MCSTRCALLTALLSVTATSALAAPPAIYNLGTLGGSTTWAAATNNSGQITGTSTVEGESQHAFLYTGTPGRGGMMHDLGTLGGTDSQGSDINDSGQVAGTSLTRGDFESHAFLYTGVPGSGGIMHDLGTLGGPFSEGYGINNSGQVVGFSFTASLDGHAFLYTGTPGIDGMMHDLGILPFGSGSAAYDVNDSGQVVGTSGNHAFLYTGSPGIDGMMHDLGTLFGGYSGAAAINNSGQVVGTSDNRAFLYTGTPGIDGMMHDLGTLGSEYSVGLGLNDRGQVVGTSWTSVPAELYQRAFVYTGTPGAGGVMIDLDAWLDANNPAEGAKWTLRYANDLTDAGLITGTGFYDDGPGGLSDGERAYLLDASSLLVVPEPSSVALVTLAIPALLRRRKRHYRLYDE